jgi:hypothetical protein
MKKLMVILLLIGIPMIAMDHGSDYEALQPKTPNEEQNFTTSYVSLDDKLPQQNEAKQTFEKLDLDTIVQGLKSLVQLLDTQMIDTSAQVPLRLETILTNADDANTYKEQLYNRYTSTFANRGIQVANSEKKDSERDLDRLFLSFDNVLSTLKKLTSDDKTNIAHCFDELITLRLYCAEYFKNEEIIVGDTWITLKDFILDFEPLKISRWNPFSWGNWYDRLHRAVGTVPAQPWDRGVTGKIQDGQVTTHCSSAIAMIKKMMEIYSTTTRKDYRLQMGQQSAALMIYVLTMNQLSILVRWQLGSTTKVGLRAAAVEVGALGIGALWRYLSGGPKKPSTPIPVNNDTR